MTGPCSGLASHRPHHPGMDRRRFLLTSLAGAFAAPLAAEAQQVGKVYRVGILGESASDPSEARLWQTFRSESSWLGGSWSHILAQELEAGA